MVDDKSAREAIEQTEKKGVPKNSPPAGPHAKEHLIDRDKTPGTGSLPEPGARETDAGPD